MPAHHCITHGGFKEVGWLNAADGEKAAWHGAFAPDCRVFGEAFFYWVVHVGGAIDQPVVAGVCSAQVELVAEGDLVLVCAAVVEVVEDSGNAGAGVSGDDGDVWCISAGQRIWTVRSALIPLRTCLLYTSDAADDTR